MKGQERHLSHSQQEVKNLIQVFMEIVLSQVEMDKIDAGKQFCEYPYHAYLQLLKAQLRRLPWSGKGSPFCFFGSLSSFGWGGS